jgi:2-isopropylmalate synthase
VQNHADASETEISSAALWDLFELSYLAPTQEDGRMQYRSHRLHDAGASANASQEIVLELVVDGETRQLNGTGNGPIAAAVDALQSIHDLPGLRIDDYQERSIGSGAKAQAWAIVEAASPGIAGTRFGAARHVNIVTASILAVLSAANRLSILSAASTD